MFVVTLFAFVALPADVAFPLNSGAVTLSEKTPVFPLTSPVADKEGVSIPPLVLDAVCFDCSKKFLYAHNRHSDEV